MMSMEIIEDKAEKILHGADAYRAPVPIQLVAQHVNAPPPNRRWLQVTAGSRIDRPCGRYHTTLKSSSGSGGFCSSIYRFQTSSVTLPLVATQ